MFDFTKCLPPELIETLLLYLNIKELGVFSQVCISWREALMDARNFVIALVL
jgi:hypothetical protein